tara:strand:+ start:227 stop:412 length:186 start_codon:yes stop_codon:yes gene_type:complete
MNSFNTQLQIEDMNDQDDYSYWALLEYCEQRDADRDSQDLHWENVYMDVNNEYQDNQPKPW